MARSAFLNEYLEERMKHGLSQYVILASGYDSSAYQHLNQLKIYEIDKPDMIQDKISRVERSTLQHEHVTFVQADLTLDWTTDLLLSGFQSTSETICSCLGISYYLEHNDFFYLIESLSRIISCGSAIVFDYQNKNISKQEIINMKLAQSAGETMRSSFSEDDIQKMASSLGLEVMKNYDYTQIDSIYFSKYNHSNPIDDIHSPIGVNYCLLIKK